MLPTIDACSHPVTGTALPDHGEVWARSWSAEETEAGLVTRVELATLPLACERTVSVRGHSVHLSYRLTNLSDEPVAYLWALHGLNFFDEHTKLVLPAGEIENVMSAEVYDFDYTKLSEYPDGCAYKFYLKEPVEEGICAIHYVKQGLSYEIRFDTQKAPYLGVWITKGGFKDEYNVALEPATGYYDDLGRAYENNRYTKIPPNAQVCWDIELRIQRIGETDG